MLLGVSIRFPNLGIELENVGKAISVFGFDIAYYGIIMAFAMLSGYVMASFIARKTNQDPDLYLDFAMIAIVVAIVGARLYYVIFNLSYYLANPLEIFNLRNGGLAIYGGVIAATITAFLFCRVKKVSFWELGDTAVYGLVVGQIIGRWGNFFNREAFGDYTNNLFAMQLRKSEVAASNITQSMLNHVQTIDGVEYIQVHPTFLYESLWNLGLLMLLLIYHKYKKANGEIVALYLMGYGVGRLWIEGLRTDQLLLWGTEIPVSQIVSASAVVAGIVIFVYQRRKNKINNFYM